MTIEQILELGKMGYTKEDIEAMDKAPQDPKQEDPKKEDPKKEEPKKEEPDKLGKVFDAIAELTKVIQANNITKSQNPQNEVKSAEVLLAEVVRPPRKEK